LRQLIPFKIADGDDGFSGNDTVDRDAAFAAEESWASRDMAKADRKTVRQANAKKGCFSVQLIFK
jgi:hypothetical protein